MLSGNYISAQPYLRHREKNSMKTIKASQNLKIYFSMEKLNLSSKKFKSRKLQIMVQWDVVSSFMKFIAASTAFDEKALNKAETTRNDERSRMKSFHTATELTLGKRNRKSPRLSPFKLEQWLKTV